MQLSLKDRIVLAIHNNKAVPPNIRESNSLKECCINCIHCDDEVLTLCLKHDCFEVEWDEICNDFDDYMEKGDRGNEQIFAKLRG